MKKVEMIVIRTITNFELKKPVEFCVEEIRLNVLLNILKTPTDIVAQNP